jgi:hypothetical protein
MLTALERGEPLGRDDLTLTRFLTEIVFRSMTSASLFPMP